MQVPRGLFLVTCTGTRAWTPASGPGTLLSAKGANVSFPSASNSLHIARLVVQAFLPGTQDQRPHPVTGTSTSESCEQSRHCSCCSRLCPASQLSRVPSRPHPFLWPQRARPQILPSLCPPKHLFSLACCKAVVSTWEFCHLQCVFLACGPEPWPLPFTTSLPCSVYSEALCADLTLHLPLLPPASQGSLLPVIGWAHRLWPPTPTLPDLQVSAIFNVYPLQRVLLCSLASLSVCSRLRVL